MKYNKFLSIILPFTALFCLAACQSTDKSKQGSQFVSQNHLARNNSEVAILMPLSGPEGVLGQQYDELIKIGLSEGARTDLKITSYDGSDSAKVLQAMEEIVARKTKIILGPINSPLTKLIAGRALEQDMVIISLSNDPTLADRQLFVFGHAPLRQLYRMLDYIFAQNHQNIITLLPAGYHSQEVNQIIQNGTIENNATLVRTELYLSSPESINKAVNIISDTVDNINESADNTSKPVIYIADDKKNLSLVLDSISKYNLDKKAVIVGDNRIDNSNNKDVNLLYTGSLNFLNNKTIAAAQKTTIHHLSSMHLIAYDLGKIVGQNIGHNLITENFLSRIDNNIFFGLSGDLSFTDSIAQRKYDIIERKEGIYNTIDIAR
ncbi:MAG: penicillin-binding protein activator [Rickettsiaceae bacterium]|nr:MAG: penicillin-binding protein activator [Rickettsiaceae bacterium]